MHSISGAAGLFMNMTSCQNIFRNIFMVAAFTNACLNLLLTLHYGIYGAVIAAMASIVGWNAATLWYMKSKFGKITGFFPGITARLRLG